MISELILTRLKILLSIVQLFKTLEYCHLLLQGLTEIYTFARNSKNACVDVCPWVGC
jgi:hypothetical protein